MKIANPLFKATMLSTISLVSLGFGSAAFAQETPADDAAAATAEDTSADAVDDQEIVVTATGRPQIAQDIPVAVSVIGGPLPERRKSICRPSSL